MPPSALLAAFLTLQAGPADPALAERIPQNAISVAESGIGNGADIARLRAAGYKAFLIGESLMKAESPGEALKSLLSDADREVSALSTKD